MQTIVEFDKAFADENACRQFLQDMRWPHGVTCPRCGNTKVWALKSKPFYWVCKSGETTTDPEGKQVTCAKNLAPNPFPRVIVLILTPITKSALILSCRR